MRRPVTAAALAAFCGERIARFKVPARFFRVASFPLTSSGKIRKRELRELSYRGALERLP
jgi:acyl-CoA synthetase (AMP-forming)/AMP-acid ligase II